MVTGTGRLLWGLGEQRRSQEHFCSGGLANMDILGCQDTSLPLLASPL